MSKEIELELTYLAKELPKNLDIKNSMLIHDIYIPEEKSHAVLRLRARGEKYEITKKEPLDGKDSSKQLETTISLTKDEFRALAKCSQKEFIKRRYFLKIEGVNAELDVYQAKLSGLVTIDFEFPSIEAMEKFKTPGIACADVSQDVVCAGGYLAGKSYNDIAPQLAKYNYKKLDYEETA